MLQWVRKNKFWIFSGIGVAPVVAVFGWLFVSAGNIINVVGSPTNSHSISEPNSVNGLSVRAGKSTSPIFKSAGGLTTLSAIKPNIENPFGNMATLVSHEKTGKPVVEIHSIAKNNLIKGRVMGVSGPSRLHYKIIVYVRTDKWYLHPFANGGVGRAFAFIRPNGNWQIPTIRREFPAEAIAALLVDRYSTIPAATVSLDGIAYVSKQVVELSISDDYGNV